jgi:hypothetical protein
MIGGFQIICDIFFFGKWFYRSSKHSFRLFIRISDISTEYKSII